MKQLMLIAVCCFTATSAMAQPYTANREGEAVKLADAKAQTEVWILPSVGNIAYRMTVKGHDILRWPHPSIEAFKASPNNIGIPFMGPWINRLDEQAFYANGRKYNFDMARGGVRGAIPIHGYLSGARDWTLVEASADGKGAWVTTSLDFYRNPQWMQLFPFAHTLQMTYRLADGALEVRTRIDNLSVEPMPVAIGFHPYFQLTDSTREGWVLTIGAKSRWLLAENKIPTGEIEPADTLLVDRKAAALKDLDLDDVFGDLERDAQGRAVMSVKGKTQQLDVLLGPNYRAIVVYSPGPKNAHGGCEEQPPAATAAQAGPSIELTGARDTVANRGYVCFEPMAGITNSMNLAHKGIYQELQSIAPGTSWEESFWLRPSGF